MRIDIDERLGALAEDFRAIASRLDRNLDAAVKQVARDGNRIAQANARRTAGSHGKHYPRAFDVEKRGPATYVYGPNAAMPQGGMSFEFGSRNQPPHLDLAHSADVIGPMLERKVAEAVAEALR